MNNSNILERNRSRSSSVASLEGKISEQIIKQDSGSIVIESSYLLPKTKNYSNRRPKAAILDENYIDIDINNDIEKQQNKDSINSFRI